MPCTQLMQRLRVPVNIHVLTVHTRVHYIMSCYTRPVHRACEVHYACISADSASVRTTKSTIQLQNALCNIAQRSTRLKMRSFQSRWIMRQHVDTVACCTCVEQVAKQVCL